MARQSETSKEAGKLPDNARLLLVDDEPNILRSLRRSFGREPYEVVTVSSGEGALELLSQQRFDLVISDARMPGMDGPSLLAEVRRRSPWTIRILLTGHSDHNSTIKAINEGQIYRYIQKPWDDDELRLTIRQALAFQHSERRRLALEKLTRKQNAELRALNGTLENKVEARTEELKQTADMLDLAYQELRQSYVTATEVFSSLINQRMPYNGQTNPKVILLIKAFAEHHRLDDEQTQNLAMAAALYNLGKLAWPDELFETPSDLLGKNQAMEYRKYPVTGEQLLMSLEPLRQTARIIRHHQERWNGDGMPDRLQNQQIPLGSRMLKLAVDFVELQFGLILDRKVSRADAVKLIRQYRGRVYDPELTDQFLTVVTELAPDIEHDAPDVLALDTLRVEPGMILAQNLYSASGMLLLNAGKQLTSALIDKLVAFEKSEPDKGTFTLYVRRPEQQLETTP